MVSLNSRLEISKEEEEVHLITCQKALRVTKRKQSERGWERGRGREGERERERKREREREIQIRCLQAVGWQI